MKQSSTPTASRILRPGSQAIAAAPRKVIGPAKVDHQSADGHSIKVLHQEDGSIGTIEVTCACGQTIVVRCQYE